MTSPLSQLPASRTVDPGALTAMLRPEVLAVIGASAERATQGNQVLANLRRWAFPGEVIPVHRKARFVESLPTVSSVAELPEAIDLAMVCVPASGVCQVLKELEARRCRSAIEVAAGFSPAEAAALKDLTPGMDMAVGGPNCMGLINASDAIALYTAPFRDPLPVGPVSLVAQSGSAAIALVNSPGLAFAKVVSSGNEVMVSSADYLSWFARDEATGAVGLVIESIADPERFAEAARSLRRAGKALAVLKVGRSPEGGRATQAHTGAMVGSADAYEAFFRREGIPLARDYDELVALLQCLTAPGLPHPRGRRLGIVSISGGEGALGCDIAREAGMDLAHFGPATVSMLRDVLPGAAPENPVDLGASVERKEAAGPAVLHAVLDEPEVDAVLVLQDAQSTLPLNPSHRYLRHLEGVVQVARDATKPVVVASNSSADTHPLLEEIVSGTCVPLIRGVREAVTALGALSLDGPATPGPGPGGAQLPHRRRATDGRTQSLRTAVAGCHGALPWRLTQEVLSEYEMPLARSAVAGDAEEAVARATDVGYPLVVKVVSRDVPHRHQVGGVALGIDGERALRQAVAGIEERVRQARPEAEIEGFEIQESLTGWVEAMVGFVVEPPFGPLMLVGTGGVLVESMDDRVTDLGPLDGDQASAMIRRSRLPELLDTGGARTPLGDLAQVVAGLSLLARDFSGALTEVDLNPVLVERGTGRVRVVDALMVAAMGPDQRGRAGGAMTTKEQPWCG